MAGSGINNVTNSTGNIDIGNLQTSGDINIGANVGRLVDSIINIGTGGTVANPINIGSSTSLTSVGGTLGVTAGIITNKLNPLTTSSSLFIGDNSSSGTIAIKGTDGSTGTVAICDGPTTACTINLGSNACTTKIYGLQKLDTAATASCDIALTQTTGVLNIGTGARLITVPGNGVINIGTGSGAVVNPINIGGASSATSIGGTLKSTGIITATGGIKSNSYDINLLSPSELAFGASVTNDVVRIAEGITTGQVLIGNGASCNGSVYIMTSGTSARTIGIGSTTATTTINLNGTVTVNGNLTLTSALTLPVASYTPTAGTQLGGVTTGSFTTPSSAFSTQKTVATVTVPTIGLYLCTFSFQVNFTVLPTVNYITISGTSTGFPAAVIGMNIITTGSNGGMSGSFFAKITSVGTITLVYNVTGTVDSLSSNLYQINRLA